MSIREKTVIRGLVSLLGASALCSAGVVAATLAVQGAQQVPPTAAPDRIAQFAAQASRDLGPPVDPARMWVAPTAGEISSGFGERWGTVHKGVDIANDIGTPIRASSSGTVIDSGPASGYGLWIRISHQRDIVSIYGHIDESFVEVGQQVRAGQLIATMGDRGESTGPHLHFQVEVSGVPVDPVLFYREVAARLTH
ncbi:M23 family metallopeptidase [Saccharopolyspora soli]|uniref:M23 family metallopeptidase n=1 Tax=Saccharopolyspora soli TaxID=2926618 RepID=UPI0027E17FA4|nr:M23 family metallopeptidase [Saccharopolyspora soli]